MAAWVFSGSSVSSSEYAFLSVILPSLLPIMSYRKPKKYNKTFWLHMITSYFIQQFFSSYNSFWLQDSILTRRAALPCVQIKYETESVKGASNIRGAYAQVKLLSHADNSSCTLPCLVMLWVNGYSHTNLVIMYIFHKSPYTVL